MSNNNKTPAIRFKGFTDTWEQRKLGECAEFNPKSELPDIFEYVDLESVVGTDILSHRTESKSSAPSRAQRLAQKGDVFYQTVRPYQKNNCQYTGNDYLQRKAVAENFLRRVVILFSHVNRGSRRTARAYQCRKRRNNHNNRQTYAHARQSQAALNGDMPDIYPIDDIIKHIDKLCDYRRNRQL